MYSVRISAEFPAIQMDDLKQCLKIGHDSSSQIRIYVPLAIRFSSHLALYINLKQLIQKTNIKDY